MKDINENVVAVKSKTFAVKVVKLRKYLRERQEYDISRQLLRSGTSIGANIKEAIRGQSVPDFVSKMNIALKEASESEYWIELLYDTEYIDKILCDRILPDCQELIKLLTSIVKTTKQNLNNSNKNS